MDIKKAEIKATAVVATVSERRGVELTMQFEKSVNQKKFRDYLLKLRNLYPFRRIALVLDNLMVHKTNMIKKKYEELNIETIFNVPY